MAKKLICFGRILTGKIGADNVDGLSLRVNLTEMS